MANLLGKGDHDATFLLSQPLFLVKEDKRLGAAGDTYLCPSVHLQMVWFCTGHGERGTEGDLKHQALLLASPQKLVSSAVSQLTFM